MKVTEAVEKAIHQRVETIGEEIQKLKDERTELQEALGRPAKKVTRARLAPNREALKRVLIERPGLTAVEAAEAAGVKKRSAHGALKALQEQGDVYQTDGSWYPSAETIAAAEEQSEPESSPEPSEALSEPLAAPDSELEEPPLPEYDGEEAERRFNANATGLEQIQ